MVEFEADDALATGAFRWGADDAVEQVVICSPDKDLAQCVRGSRIVCLDRRRRLVLDEAGTIEKFGVPPASVPGWGAKSAGAVLARYGRIEAIPDDASQWAVTVRGAEALAESLRESRREAALYKTLATLRQDVPLPETLADLEWRGARREELAALAHEIADDEVVERVARWRA